MYIPTTLQAPRIHKTRPQVYAIGHKVNSLLSESSLSTCETWLLPQTCVLCMTRNQEEDHGQDGEDTKRTEQEEELLGSISSRTSGSHRTSDAWSPHQLDGTADESYSGRTTDQGWTSDDHQPPNDRQHPEIRQWLSRAKTPDVRQVPDYRTLASHQTSGCWRGGVGRPARTGHPAAVASG